MGAGAREREEVFDELSFATRVLPHRERPCFSCRGTSPITKHPPPRTTIGLST